MFNITGLFRKSNRNELGFSTTVLAWPTLFFQKARPWLKPYLWTCLKQKFIEIFFFLSKIWSGQKLDAYESYLINHVIMI